MNRMVGIAAIVIFGMVSPPNAMCAESMPAESMPAELPDAASLWFLGDVVIEPDGHVSNIDWRNYREMPEEALAELERRISGWEFRPGQVDGQAVVTGTSLVIHAVAIERPGGRFGLEIAQVVVGPTLVDAWLLPASPYRQVLTSGPLKSGHLVLDAIFDPDGGKHVEIVEFETSTGNRRYRSAFKRDSRSFPDQWTVRYETLAGMPVVAKFRFINRICYHRGWCKENAAESMAGLPEVPYEQPVPLESVADLVTEVTTVQILPRLPSSNPEP